MKIVKVQLHPVAVERQYSTVIARAGGAAKEAVSKSHFLFVELRTAEGDAGWGEISDIPADELPNTEEHAELLARLMVGRDPFQLEQLHHDLAQHFDLAGSALARYTACALDMAMYDLAGKAAGRPVADLLGGAARRDVHISWVAFIREQVELLREEVREKVREGFTAFKLKVGVDIELDEQRLAVLREEAGERASIKIDANEGWAVDEAIKNIKRLDRYRLAGVETPVPRENPRHIAAVRRHSKVPILEHVRDLQYGLALIKAEAVDVFNIATTGAGGLWPARKIVALAESAGVGLLIGSTVELGPGTLAQLHLAGTTRNLVLPSDLVGPGLYQRDVLEKPLEYRKGRLAVPTGKGLGGSVSREKLAAAQG